MDVILPFLRAVHHNDSKEWYLAHREEYLEAFRRNASSIEKLIHLIGEFDEDIAKLEVSDCSFALPRDRKLKIDDRLFNDFLSGCFYRDGKYGGWAGYYYQISPLPSSSGGSFLTVGIYQPNKELMDYFRREFIDNGDYVHKLVKETGFKPYLRDQLRRMHPGYRPKREHLDYLYLRSMMLIKPLDEWWFLRDDWHERTAEEFRRCKPFVDYVNSIIARYREESPFPVGHGLRPIPRHIHDQILRSIREKEKE